MTSKGEVVSHKRGAEIKDTESEAESGALQDYQGKPVSASTHMSWGENQPDEKEAHAVFTWTLQVHGTPLRADFRTVSSSHPAQLLK